MNPFAERVSGRPSAEMIGRHYLEFVSDDERKSVEASVDRGLAGDPESENERVLVAADGDRRVIRWRSVVPRDADGVPEGLLSVGADVTDRRRSESDLLRATGELEATVRELEEVKAKLEEDNVYLKEEIGSRTEHSDIIGSSDALLYVLHKIRQVADTDATVLIQGETGVGKELVAHAIHDSSNRSSGPFLAVNCAALPASLIDSELFGHERGAFTGADRRRKGRFELADGGTLFLDEVAELPLDVQPKLLRALQEKTIERVGGTRTIEVDVRLIAATNRNLEAEVDVGRFRQDLFYRLEVYPITVPSLRDRKDDIEILARHFAQAFAARHRVELTEIPPEVLRRLEGYPWPGNVRELQNVIERAVLNANDGVLRLVSPLEARNGPDPEPQRPPSRTFRTLDEVQRDHILEVLASCDGQIAGRGGAGQILGIHPNTLRSRLKKLGISTPK
jgi:PAS domain S-box-containing protein